jgi:drug/metabolite transporter (DMT)-like permease
MVVTERPGVVDGDAALRGLGWMLVANVLFASMTIAARLASDTVSWQEVGMSRAGVGALVALGLALHRGARLTTRRRGLSWARSILGTGAMLCTFYALCSPDLPLGDAVTLGATSPIFLALLSAPLLGERPGRAVWGVTVVAFVGIALIAGPQLAVTGPAGGLAAAVALAAAVFSALAMVFLRRMRSGAGSAAESVESIALHFSLVSFVVHALLALPTLSAPGPGAAALLLAVGLFGGVAQLAMTRAYALTEAARLGTAGYAGTVLAQIGAVIVLGERPGPIQIAGALLVVGAGVALAWSTAREAGRAGTVR